MRKVMTMAIAGGTAVVLAGGGLAYGAFSTKDITLSVDGVERQVETRAATVEEVLERQGITVGKHDVVAPAPETEINEGTRIAVQYGREITLTVDGVTRTHWTTARSVDQLLGSLGMKSEGLQIEGASRSQSIGRTGLDLELSTLKKVVVIVKGKPVTIETTGNTVAAALKKAKVDPDDNDEVSHKSTALLVQGMTITFVDVEVKKVTETESIDFETKEVATDDLYEGETKVQTEGVAGEREIVISKRYEDGELVKEKEISNTVTREPVTKVVLVGTKEKPAPPSNSGGSGGGGVPSGSVWHQLAMCESTNNPKAINPVGPYYGLYQFSAETWRSVGGTGLPTDHSAAEQTKRAKILQARSGWGQWPSCARQLGLL